MQHSLTLAHATSVLPDAYVAGAWMAARSRIACTPMDALQDVVAALAEELQVPGVAVGVLHDGREEHAFHGVTSIENPLAVDERTLFSAARRPRRTRRRRSSASSGRGSSTSTHLSAPTCRSFGSRTRRRQLP